jgi:polysaccharide chain length determinant protein (PEP-CTERM system associated)
MEAALEPSAQMKSFVDIAWRRKGWFLGPVLLAMVVGAAIVAMTPKRYLATTTILVTRQSVPEDIVRSTVTLRIEERMRSLQVQILSRSYLEKIAREFDMILPDAGDAEVEKACFELGAAIRTELDRPNFSWFRISVADVDPRRAAGIANRLAELFIEQHARMRASQSTGTLAATENWEAKYRLELAQRDAAIAEFSRDHLYELPDQQQANLQLLNSAQSRVTQLTSDIQSRNDRLVTLRAQRRAQRAFDAVTGVPETGNPETARIATLRRELAELLVDYTEENPLVKRKRGQIAEFLRRQPAVASAEAEPSPSDPASVEIVAAEDEIRALERDRAHEAVNVDLYRRRIADAPQQQQRFLELTRDYATVKLQFDAAVAQNEQARRAQELEVSKLGEQFQIQDRAYPPAVPFAPDPVRYLVGALVLGLVLGAGAVAAREALDQSVWNEEEFAARCPDLPVYGVIPNLDAVPRGNARAPVEARADGARLGELA